MLQSQFHPLRSSNDLRSRRAAVESVLRSPYLTQGPVVQPLRKQLLTKLVPTHGVMRTALLVLCILLALWAWEGDRLWTSPITFVASANGRYCGAEVDFVDIDPLTGLMSVSALEKKLKAEPNGALPKVVVPVCLTGSSTFHGGDWISGRALWIYSSGGCKSCNWR